MSKYYQQGLISAMVISLVACGGSSGGDSKPASSASSSVVTSSVLASSVASSALVSSSAATSISSIPASSSPASSSNPGESSSVPASVSPASSSSMTNSSSAPVSSVAESSTASEVPQSSSSASSLSSALSSSVQSSVVQSSVAQSSSSSSVGGISTTFTVTISAPLLSDSTQPVKTRKGTARKPAETIARESLAVVVVNLAGTVVRNIPLDETNSTLNADGSWSIRVPGYPQLDCIVIANLNGPITLFEPGDNVFNSDLLFAPTTGQDLEVSLASTAAYQTFVEQLDALGGEGTFESLGLDVSDLTQLTVLQNLIQTISDVLEDQVFVGATSIADALAQVEQQVTDIVQVEASNIQDQVDPATNTLAAGLEAGGVYWFEASEPSEIYYGGFSALNTPEQERYYDGDQFQPLPEYELDGNVVLTTSGWVISEDRFQATALNQDGSVNLSAADAPSNSVNAKATQVINLSGRTISTFFGAYGDTRGLVSQINPASTFAEGALGYRITLQSTSDIYTLWYNTGYNFGTGAVCPWDKNGDGQLNDLPSNYGGNCETVNSIGWNTEGFAQSSTELTTIASLTSPDLAPGTVGAKLIAIDWPNGDVIGVQLVNDTNKTARFYLHDWFENTQTLLGTATWSQLTLPNLEGDAATAIGFTIPNAVRAEGDFDTDENYVLFALHDGFVRRGGKSSAGEILETGELLINGVAKNNLLAAFNYQPAIAGAWVIGGDYVMFRKDGTFAQVKTSNEDPDCQVGFAYGQYSWNPTTSAFSVEIDEDTTAVDPQDSCSVAGIETLTITGATMTLTEGEDTFALTKITASESAPLAGAWVVDGDWFTFTGDNTFIHAKIENDDPNCQIGWANGSFTWNASTGLLGATVAQDFTDDFTETTCTLEGDVTALLDGNTLSVTAEEDNLTLKRFGNPLN